MAQRSPIGKGGRGGDNEVIPTWETVAMRGEIDDLKRWRRVRQAELSAVEAPGSQEAEELRREIARIDRKSNRLSQSLLRHRAWWFDDPAGTGSGGEPDSCDFEFSGEFNCEGNPSIGIDHPILKWDAIQTEECEAGATGSATLCFFTAAAPAPATVPVILIKNGQNVCEGTISGDCPFPCPVSIEEGTWSSLKGLYR